MEDALVGCNATSWEPRQGFEGSRHFFPFEKHRRTQKYQRQEPGGSLQSSSTSAHGSDQSDRHEILSFDTIARGNTVLMHSPPLRNPALRLSIHSIFYPLVPFLPCLLPLVRNGNPSCQSSIACDVGEIEERMDRRGIHDPWSMEARPWYLGSVFSCQTDGSVVRQSDGILQRPMVFLGLIRWTEEIRWISLGKGRHGTSHGT